MISFSASFLASLNKIITRKSYVPAPCLVWLWLGVRFKVVYML
jgi:hypothetical protein